MDTTIQRATARGFLQARAITRTHAKTFYFASLFLPKDKRNAAYAVYAVCRISDAAVDTPASPDSIADLDRVACDIDTAYGTEKLTDELLLAFRRTVTAYAIPKEYFDDLLSGMLADTHKNRYANFDELKDYCYKAAGVVGLMMLHIFGFSSENAKRHAVSLGIAMQLTNIIRDIKEDYARRRIYLPQDEMARFGISEADIAQEKTGKNFIEFLKFQIGRAQQLYADAEAGIVMMIPDARARLVVRLMQQMYAGILDAVEKNQYNVFSKRAHLTLGEKILMALRIILTGGM